MVTGKRVNLRHGASTPAVLLAVAAMAATLGACSKTEEGNTVAPTATASATPVPVASTTAQTGQFDIASLPVSTAPLGAFPFITLPQGYSVAADLRQTSGFSADARGDTKDFARYPFWVSGAPQWVEGKFYQTGFTSEAGKSFSIFEVAKNFDNAVKQMGGQKVSEEKIPSSFYYKLDSEIRDGFREAIKASEYNKTHVWVVRRNDGNIWIALAGDEKQGGFVVGQEAALNQTTKLLSASDLKSAIETQGKASMTVNFATDRTEILPESQPQIGQVVTLLRDAPALRLAVGGHTDGTGTKAHNQTLSEGRAKSVVASLVAQGVAAGRLQAKGFGDSQPVADNTSEVGKAQNRRVELVKL